MSECMDGRCECFDAGMVACGNTCVDLLTDAENCGECGQTCGMGGFCTGGVCECLEGFSVCERDGCVDLQTDANNCGECQRPCPEGAICAEGECLCTDGEEICNFACTDTDTDTANCGYCGNRCTSGLACVDGDCGCPDGFEVCGDGCQDLQNDPANCGACGLNCGIGGCTGGVCDCADGGCECPDPLTLCEDAECYDLEVDPLNCGYCGNACEEGFLCERGLCVCPEGLTACDGYCVDLATNPDYCGDCDDYCYTGDHEGYCSDGRCEYFCAEGYADCDRTFGRDACETRIDRDPLNCGACEAPCFDGDVCAGGGCTEPHYVVAAGYTNTCALRPEGAQDRYCWGDNRYGQEGNGDQWDEPSGGYRRMNDVDLVDIAISKYHGCGVTLAGRVLCWGSNAYGALGQPVDVTEAFTPTVVPGVLDAVRVDVGFRHSCAVQADGTLLCCGNLAELGVGQDEPCDNVPGIAGYPGCAVVEPVVTMIGVEDVFSGFETTCAISGGVLSCWGGNCFGQAGVEPGIAMDMRCAANPTVWFPNEIRAADTAAVGWFQACLVDGGSVYCWGSNRFGQLGHHPPIGESCEGVGFCHTWIPGLVAGGLDEVTSIDSGEAFTCAIQGDSVYCWGNGEHGQIGVNGEGQSILPVEVEGVTEPLAVGAGRYHACAIQGTDGAVMCWGRNASYAVGPGHPGTWPDPQVAVLPVNP